MHNQKISFIICTNQEEYFTECKRYIEALAVPTGLSTEVVPITNASSMAAGYNQGMRQSDAKYKVYLHQDVFLLNRNFIADTLAVFSSHDNIGMLGLVGTKRLPDNGCMWTTPMRTGALRSCVLNTVDDYFDLPISQTKGYAPVQAVDGLLIMTQYDIPWREDLDLGWDFYDVSHSLEFSKAGYRIVVPHQTTPWVLHDNGFLHLGGYHQSRKIFLEEYFPARTHEIESCDQSIATAAQKQSALAAANKIKSMVLQQIAAGEYDTAIRLLQSHMAEYQEDEEYCILCLFAGIDAAEREADIPGHLFTMVPPDINTILSFHQQIKFCLWRLEYPFSADIKSEARNYLNQHLSGLAIQRFQTFTKVT